MITSEIQKQRYIYYRCTKKRGECKEPFLWEEALVKQIDGAIDKVGINNRLKKFLLGKIDEESRVDFARSSPTIAINNRIGEIDKKLDILLDGYISEVVGETEYKRKKSSLLNERLRLKEKLSDLDSKGKGWLELSALRR